MNPKEDPGYVRICEPVFVNANLLVLLPRVNRRSHEEGPQAPREAFELFITALLLGAAHSRL